MRSFCAADERLHIVHSRLAINEECRRGECALGEKCAGVRLVLEGDGLIGGADHNLMLADDIAHSDGVNADLLACSLALTASAAVERRLGTNVAESIGKHKCRSARSIDLAVVVLFNNFDLRLGESRRRLLCKLTEKKSGIFSAASAIFAFSSGV